MDIINQTMADELLKQHNAIVEDSARYYHEEIDFSNKIYNDIVFTGADFTVVNFGNSVFNNCIFTDCILPGTGNIWLDMGFKRSTLNNVQFNNCDAILALPVKGYFNFFDMSTFIYNGDNHHRVYLWIVWDKDSVYCSCDTGSSYETIKQPIYDILIDMDKTPYLNKYRSLIRDMVISNPV